LRLALGHVRVAELTNAELVRFAEARRKEGRANATINRDLEALRAALRLAARAGRIVRVPQFPAKLRERVRRGFYDAEEVERLCAASPPWLSEIIRFAFTTGWRRSELWDFGGSGSTSPSGRSGYPTRRAAAGGSCRSPANSRESSSGSARRGRSSGEGKPVALSEWVFHDSGHRITRKRWDRAWNAARKAARLGGRLFHDFRRSAARRLINAGASQAAAMRITGHETASMFLRYQIAETADAARALEGVAARVERSSGGRLAVLK
jgi:integrase